MEQKYFQTGCKKLDKLLNGGFPSRSISLVYGEAGTGKTTLALQTSIQAAIKGFKVLFLDSDQSFSIQRLAQIAINDIENASKNIFIFQPETFIHQAMLIENLEKYVNKNFGLIVIDTLTSLYRIAFGSRESIFALNRELNRQLAYLNDLSMKYDLSVLVLSQVHAKPYEDSKTEVIAKRVLMYWSKIALRINLTSKPNIRELVLERFFSEELNNKKCCLSLTKNGFKDL
ncbi:MAG: ATPase domain-containing protein [Candidatus Bathyarchaeia archaeon]